MLRESLLETNEEIKQLTAAREGLEKALEHIRKDLNLNHESSEIRKSRPSREKVRHNYSQTPMKTLQERQHYLRNLLC